MMNWILLVMAGIAAVIVAMLLGGAMAPRHRVSSRALHTDRDAETVFALLRQADGPPRWCADLPTMRCTSEQPPHEVTFVLLNDDGRDIGHWQVSVETVRTDMGSHTLATISESIAVDNLLSRFLQSFGGGGVGPKRYLDAVAQQLGVSGSVSSERGNG